MHVNARVIGDWRHDGLHPTSPGTIVLVLFSQKTGSRSHVAQQISVLQPRQAGQVVVGRRPLDCRWARDKSL